MTWQAFIYVGIGGFLGANTRYFLSLLLTERLVRIIGIPLPFGTAMINITGSMLLAMVTFWAGQRASNLSDTMKLMLGTGFLGAYTTFSTFANESINLLQGEQVVLGWMYIIGTNALCLLGVVLGLFLANRIWTI